MLKILGILVRETKIRHSFFLTKNAWFFYRQKLGIYIAGVSFTGVKGDLPPA